MSRDDESLKVVDTSNVLTKEELLELKRLANLSKTAKFIVSILFGAIALLGADHLVEWIERAK